MTDFLVLSNNIVIRDAGGTPPEPTTFPWASKNDPIMTVAEKKPVSIEQSASDTVFTYPVPNERKPYDVLRKEVGRLIKKKDSEKKVVFVNRVFRYGAFGVGREACERVL